MLMRAPHVSRGFSVLMRTEPFYPLAYTGMVASSGPSAFCSHLGQVIGDLFCMLHAVRHGMEALVHTKKCYPREAAAPRVWP